MRFKFSSVENSTLCNVFTLTITIKHQSTTKTKTKWEKKCDRWMWLDSRASALRSFYLLILCFRVVWIFPIWTLSFQMQIKSNEVAIRRYCFIHDRKAKEINKPKTNLPAKKNSYFSLSLGKIELHSMAPNKCSRFISFSLISLLLFSFVLFVVVGSPWSS